ncbi:ABC transporter permease subunit [Paracoccus seriniphilus]|uniref:Amino acid ABC transporter membrane protein 1, PAAT family n=1 Tax=Paracoccus seriniphilus TaxID=184748 RepID=A0A239Q0B0_9RHOB|nr:ABC transporter permease subunit [Paracoccus seriniphilus]WCR15691.1 ABC transporter permease subunit [Paracoccus seriniphilus]SNT75632.1 amino acid ABC transporter membrane protein 1, PAAT family [Paracoccus seriniphilus]
MTSLRFRNNLIQIAFLSLLVLLAVSFVVIAGRNMAAQGITSGFGFLERATGWDVGFSLLPFSIRDPYWWTLLIGFLNTLFVGYFSIIFATLVGLVVAMMRISGNPVLNLVSLGYVELIRNIPPILQVLAWYGVFSALPAPKQAIQLGDSIFLSARGLFVPVLNVHPWALLAISLVVLVMVGLLCWVAFGRRFLFRPRSVRLKMQGATVIGAMLAVAAIILVSRIPDMPLLSVPELKGFNFRGGISVSPELATILVATTIYGSAYVAEIVRGGFLSVPEGQIEAGRALGMPPWKIFACIQLPITIRNVIPMMTNFYVWLIKATTLGIAIGFSDLFMVVASAINQSGQTIELIIILAASFWLLNGVIVAGMNRIDARLRVKR